MNSASARTAASHRTRSGCCAILVAVGMWSASSSAGLDLDFLRDTPIMYLTESDKALQRDAALYVLEHAKSNAVREWRNSITGFAGRIEGKGDWIATDGQRCRKIKLVAQAKGAESVYVLPLCKNAAGEWFIGSGLVLSPSKDGGRVAAAFF